jgi:hypothetical protein
MCITCSYKDIVEVVLLEGDAFNIALARYSSILNTSFAQSHYNMEAPLNAKITLD